MTELFNGGETDITCNDKFLLIEWLSLQLMHRLSKGVVSCVPWLLPIPIFWRLPIPFVSGMMNAIWVCGGVVCMLFCLFIVIKSWEPRFWGDNCSHVWVSVPGIKLITIFLSWYHPNYALKYDLCEKVHFLRYIYLTL